MKKLVMLALAATAMVCTGCDPLIGPPGGDDTLVGKSIPFRTVAHKDGAASSIVNSQQIVVTSESQWSNLWAEIHATIRPQPELPAIDFTTTTVLALFAGTKNSGGHSIDVTQITQEPATMKVQFETTAPGSGCITSSVITHPFHIVAIAKTALPVGFHGSNVTIHCN